MIRLLKDGDVEETGSVQVWSARYITGAEKLSCRSCLVPRSERISKETTSDIENRQLRRSYIVN